jgi:hypothetical protein
VLLATAAGIALVAGVVGIIGQVADFDRLRDARSPWAAPVGWTPRSR